MATNILMPALSPTMTEGILSKWLKKEGDTIKSGDIIAEIETDKATMEVEAADDGVLAKILVAEGSEAVPVNAPIAVLVKEDENIANGESASTGAARVMPQSPVPEATRTISTFPSAPSSVSVADTKRQTTDNSRILISPLARRMAHQAGINLGDLVGSGPKGRIVKADVEATRSNLVQPAPTVLTTEPQVQLVDTGSIALKASDVLVPHDVVPHSAMRKTIAKRMQASKETIPHFYLWVDIDIDELLKLRAELNSKSPKDGPGVYSLSVNDFLIKAAALSLRRVPEVNSSYTEEAMIRYHDVDISVAVAIPEGLITPILRRVDQKGLAIISNEMKDLAERAKAGKLRPEEYQGGSFSISNLGMYGITNFSAIINPPQSAILAIGAAERRPAVRGNEIGVATMMTVGIACDHRAFDGTTGAEFLSVFKGVVETPLSLML